MSTSQIKVHPHRGSLSAELTVPGDKSVSQRLAMLAGISRGASRIRGFLRHPDNHILKE